MSTSAESLKGKLEDFASRAQRVMSYCKGNKQQTRQSLVEPYLEEILGVDSQDPEIVKLEFSFRKMLENYPVKNGVEKVDYAIFEPGKSSEDPVWIVDTEVVGNSLDHSLISRLKSYLMRTRVKYAALTNGIQWHWYNLYTWDTNFSSEASLIFKNNVCRPSDQDLEWLSTVREGLHKSSAEEKAVQQEFLPKIRCWVQKMAKDPSLNLQKLVIYECQLPESKLVKNQMPVMLSKAFHYFMLIKDKMEMFQQRRLSNVSENRSQNNISITSCIQQGMSKEANFLTLENGHFEKLPFSSEEACRSMHALSMTELSKEMLGNLKPDSHQTFTFQSYQDLSKVQEQAIGVLQIFSNDETKFDGEDCLVSQNTRRDGWAEWQRGKKSRICRYSLNEGSEWTETKNSIYLTLDILKWCAQKHKNGKNEYYQILSNTGFGKRFIKRILVHKDTLLPSEKCKENGLPPSKYYSSQCIDGWRVYKHLPNYQMKQLVEEILAKCIRKNNTSPVLGKDLWIGIPNAYN